MFASAAAERAATAYAQSRGRLPSDKARIELAFAAGAEWERGQRSAAPLPLSPWPEGSAYDVVRRALVGDRVGADPLRALHAIWNEAQRSAGPPRDEATQAPREDEKP